MADLISALVNVRDGLTLIAFLSLVLLVAFRTQKVPELFFGLVREKLTRREFSLLLRRFMIFGFIAVVVLVAFAVLAQVLASKTRPEALTVGDLRRELASIEASSEEKLHAESQFRLALTQISERNLQAAIERLEASIRSVPTLTAKEMLVYLHRQRRDFDRAAEAWEDAMAEARERNDPLAQARLDRADLPRDLPDPDGERDLVGASEPLPPGGDGYETARELEPGFYACLREEDCFSWYSLHLERGSELLIRLRSPPDGGLAGIALYGTNGQALATAGDERGTMRGNAGHAATIYELRWLAAATGRHFLYTNADAGTVYLISVRQPA